MPIRSAYERQRKPHFIKEWRKFHKLSQTQLAEAVPTSVANLSRIENGHQDYAQSVLEALAEHLRTDPASLISRDPTKPEIEIWPLWESATPMQRVQIVKIAKALIDAS